MAAVSGAVAEPLNEPTVTAIDALMHAEDTPGAAVVVVRGEETVFARGYGYADPEREIPVTGETLFDAGSIAKTFTALGVARLLASGEVEYDQLKADLRPRIDEMRSLPSKITPQQLLHHTSGLRDWPGGIVLGGGHLDDRIDTQRVLQFVAGQRQLNGTPGLRYSYCNTGYVLLARWLELETGEPFPEWMKKTILEPLGMQSTVIPDAPGTALPDAAVGHRWWDGARRRAPRNSAVWGSSSLWTNARDLGRFMIELGRRETGLPPIVFDFARQPGRTADGGTLGYGGGMFIGTQGKRDYIGHGGAWSGFRSEWRRFPDDAVGVAVLANSQTLDAGTIVSRLARIVFDGGASAEEKSKTAELSAEQRNRLTGRYRLKDGRELEVFQAHEKLYAAEGNERYFELTARSSSELVNRSRDDRRTFRG